MDTPLLFTPEQAAAALNLGRTRIFEMLKTGQLPSVQVGRSRRITQQALQEFVQQLTGEPAATVS